MSSKNIKNMTISKFAHLTNEQHLKHSFYLICSSEECSTTKAAEGAIVQVVIVRNFCWKLK
jgi:hypothetical protein